MTQDKSATKMLIILVDETDTWEEIPLYEAIIRRLIRNEIAGATALTGIMGYGVHGKLHRRGLFGVSDDRPVAVLSVDLESKLRAVLPEIQPMVREGMILLTDVEVVPITAN